MLKLLDRAARTVNEIRLELIEAMAERRRKPPAAPRAKAPRRTQPR